MKGFTALYNLCRSNETRKDALVAVNAHTCIFAAIKQRLKSAEHAELVQAGYKVASSLSFGSDARKAALKKVGLVVHCYGDPDSARKYDFSGGIGKLTAGPSKDHPL